MMITYTVTGMTCAHCENAVREEVSALPGVAVAEVSAREGTLVVEAPDAPEATAARLDAAVAAAVEEAGYRASRAAVR
ncbi:heavy-metal-associated domain-containing protein [Corynebacterium mastitidis]|uniref:heavy-metal-associated domain-containing protein n=1 Tax=Corynebacterium mastitidis TaxID=161890 RepID=UPI00036E5108|nr:heavy-metal-associated domain-containing protein [Corynebacterium mastitidis]